MYSWPTGAEIFFADFINKFKWNIISALKLQMRYFEHNFRYLLANVQMTKQIAQGEQTLLQ